MSYPELANKLRRLAAGHGYGDILNVLSAVMLEDSDHLELNNYDHKVVVDLRGVALDTKKLAKKAWKKRI